MELLVVISIIVVLLALLAPAMDRAVYQAELTVDGAQMKGVAAGVTSYAMENGRAYPYRPTCEYAAGTGEQGVYVYNLVHPDPATGAGRDDRPYLRKHITLKSLLDPMAGKIDIESLPNDKGNWVMGNYPLWYGIRYAGVNAGKWIHRIGDRLEWTDRSRSEVRPLRSSILVSDLDAVYRSVFEFLSTHPESETKTMYFQRMQSGSSLNTIQTYSWWWSANASVYRNPLDLNYAYADGSVQRINGVERHDDRMARVSIRNRDTTERFENATGFYWQQLPYAQ